MNILKNLFQSAPGKLSENPAEKDLSIEADALIKSAFKDIPLGKAVDYHVHIIGNGSAGTGCYINPDYFTWKHPLEKIRMEAFSKAAMIDDLRAADSQYTSRLFTLADDFPGGLKLTLLAFDKTFNENGSDNLNLTKFYTPNRYVYELWQEMPERVNIAVSIHPYRKDALKELDYWAERGVKIVKWLPNSQGMDPSHRLSIQFYKQLVKNDMILLGHAGAETAINFKQFEHLGNPLLYRAALDNGVKLIMAHCAGLGMGKDLDNRNQIPIKNHDLFIRLMQQKQYEGLLFGDIAATTIINRMGEPLADILLYDEFHHRLVNGSDYPLPAVNALVSTKALSALGYISNKEATLLNEIYIRNPLTFDFVLKRTVRHPNTEKGFPASVFKQHPKLKLEQEKKAEDIISKIKE
jgi:uncharacterized protein